MEAGCDEAGRGCLAGPVFAAAVILDSSKEISPFIRDSKKLRLDQRERAASWIEQNAVAFAVESCSAEEIDQWNILQCSFIAMHRALDQLKEPFDRILRVMISLPPLRPLLSWPRCTETAICCSRVIATPCTNGKRIKAIQRRTIYRPLNSMESLPFIAKPSV